MAIKWIEGFDAYGTTDNALGAGYDEVWTGANVNLNQMWVAPGRLSGKAILMGNQATLTTPNLGNISTWFIGFAFLEKASMATDLIVSLREDDDTTLGMNLVLNSDGTIAIRRGTTTLATTAALISHSIWYNIEFRVVVHNTTGEYELKVNGVSVASATGVDTRAGATNDYANRFRLSGRSALGNGTGHTFDDVRINDSAGSAPNNTWLGDRKVITLFPTAEGDSSDFTPSAGTDNSAMVDDNGLDDDSTYVESSTTNHRDLYAVTDLSNVTEINAIQHNVICRKTDVTDFTIELVTKSGATTDVAAGETVGSTSYLNKYRIQETDPDTSSAWTDSGIDAAQFGYEVG